MLTHVNSTHGRHEANTQEAALCGSAFNVSDEIWRDGLVKKKSTLSSSLTVDDNNDICIAFRYISLQIEFPRKIILSHKNKGEKNTTCTWNTKSSLRTESPHCGPRSRLGGVHDKWSNDFVVHWEPTRQTILRTRPAELRWCYYSNLRGREPRRWWLLDSATRREIGDRRELRWWWRRLHRGRQRNSICAIDVCLHGASLSVTAAAAAAALQCRTRMHSAVEKEKKINSRAGQTVAIYW